MRSLLIAVTVLALAGPPPARAYDVTPSPAAAYKKECGACHTDYAPEFLPQASWRAIMSTLSNHFGEDASLAPDKAKAIGGYLLAHSLNARAASGPEPLRITELGWFLGVHDGYQPRDMMKSRKVKTWAACPACHGRSMSSGQDD